MHVCSLRCPCLDRARILHSGDEKCPRTQGRVTFSLPVSGPRAHAALREKFGLFFSWLEVESSLRMRFAGNGGHCVIVERLSMYDGSEMGEGSEADGELRSHHLVEA